MQYSSEKDEPKILTLLQDDNPEIDGCGEKIYYHENCRSPGRIVFTVSIAICDCPNKNPHSSHQN